MAIRQFTVGPLRGLQRAEAIGLGNLVVLAGPNGAGKSTLLDLLRQQRHALAEPGTTVMFVGPHRTWRSSALNKVSLFGYPMPSYGALLSSDNLPSFQYFVPTGMQGMQGALRESGSAEDAPAFVKTSLGRLRDRQQALVTTTWEAHGGQVPAGVVPNLFLPFEQLVSSLLPHLEFAGVDDSDPNNIQVKFRPTGHSEPLFDIDQLSSGEKAAIALLLPLVERQSDQLLAPAATDAGLVPLTMLLDEPEIHLHPLLQLQVLQYLRDLAARGAAQFILSTHSTTLLDALTDEELYLVSPATLSPDNQLSRLTTSQERLEVARAITGSTHLLTRAKPIVFLEGEEERSGLSSDVRVVTSLLPQTKSWALVPGRAKRDVIASVQRLRQEGLELPGTPVFGLVDADTDGGTTDEHVVSWPVAMIENLLLDAEAIHAVLAPFGVQTDAVSVPSVQAALERAVEDRVEDEVRLRVQRQLPVGRLALRPDQLDDAEAVARSESDGWLKKLAALDLPSLTTAAQAEVDAIVAAGTQLDRFHGKRILRAVYGHLRVQDAQLGQVAFVLLLAAHERTRERANKLAEPALKRIRLFFPAGLPEALRLGGDRTVAEPLAMRCQEHHEAWSADTPNAGERIELRSDVFAFARTVEGEQHRRLVELASRIGTP
ncbi:AAA family ATPase [Blastococcus xanthinilyticus]|uniref:AAA family ATPase n=1 Tax=Blastococcus xanthinilyticus TaxID=1564164 RepID=UPI00141257C6|nr:AAA family ATPase [Blastococcus xanthinilyticus]